MKRKRYSVGQIVAVLKQAEMGMPVADLVRHTGITEQTFYRWKEVRRPRERSGSRAEAGPGGERSAQAIGRGSQSRQGRAAGRPVKKVPGPTLASWR